MASTKCRVGVFDRRAGLQERERWHSGDQRERWWGSDFWSQRSSSAGYGGTNRFRHSSRNWKPDSVQPARLSKGERRRRVGYAESLLSTEVRDPHPTSNCQPYGQNATSCRDPPSHIRSRSSIPYSTGSEPESPPKKRLNSLERPSGICLSFSRSRSILLLFINLALQVLTFRDAGAPSCIASSPFILNTITGELTSCPS